MPVPVFFIDFQSYIMDISIIIASGRSDMSQCLESLIGQRGDIDYEIIVAWDSRSNANRCFLFDEKAQSPPNIVFIECDENNPALKRNAAACMASANVLAFIDDDAAAPEDWLIRGLAVLAERPNAAGCGGPNLPPKDESPSETIVSELLASKLGSGSGSYCNSGERRPAAVGELHLVNLFLRKPVFDAAGGFNEALGYGAEDSEFIYLCKRMTQAEFIFDPKLFVYHRRRSFGREFFSQRFRFRKQNGKLLWLRPGMYINWKRGAALGVAAAFTVFALEFPALWILPILFYASLLARGAVRVKRIGKFKWAAGMLFLHVISAAGLIAGFLAPPSNGDYRRLLRRPADSGKPLGADR